MTDLLRTDFTDDGAPAVPTKVTAADMNAISAQVNTLSVLPELWCQSPPAAAVCPDPGGGPPVGNPADFDYGPLALGEVWDNFDVPEGDITGLDSRLWIFDNINQGGTQVYDDGQVMFDGNSNLVLQCDKISGTIYAGKITSRTKWSARFGWCAFRAKVPKSSDGVGAAWWPALWLLLNGITYRPYCEFDLLEIFGNSKVIATHVNLGIDNTQSGGWGAVPAVPDGWYEDLSLGFHTYWLMWEPDRLRFGVDNFLVADWDEAKIATEAVDPEKMSWQASQQPMYFNCFFAAAPTWLPAPLDTDFPAQILIDWIWYKPLAVGATPALPIPPSANIESLFDAFGSTDTAKWDFNANAGAVSVTGGSCVLGLPNAVSGFAMGGEIRSVDDFNLIGSSIYFQLTPPNNLDWAIFRASLVPTTGSGSVAMMLGGVTSGSRVWTFEAHDDAGTSIYSDTLGYNATNHAWMRIRESSGTVYFEGSPDGGTWTVLKSTAYSGLTLNHVEADFRGETWASVSSPGSALVDNVNVAGSLSPLSALVDPFATKDTSKWVFTDNGASVTVAGSACTLALPDSAGGFSWGGQITSVNSYNFVGSSVYLHLSTVCANQDSNHCRMTIISNLGLATVQLIWNTYSSPSPFFQAELHDDTDTVIYSANSVFYNSTNHQWLRIREASGTVYWEGSPDGSTWTTMYSYAYSGVTLNSVKFDLRAESWINTVSPGVFVVDGINSTG